MHLIRMVTLCSPSVSFYLILSVLYRSNAFQKLGFHKISKVS